MNLFTKLIVLSLMATLVLAIPVAAQIQIGVGVKCGLGITNHVGTDSEGFDAKGGLMGGGFLKFSISPNLALQPEALYVQKGSKGDLGYGLTAKFNMNYLEFPMLLRVSFPLEGEISPFIIGGPAVAFVQKAEFEIEANGSSASFEIYNEKFYDLCFVVGGGIEMAAGDFNLVGEGRITIGLVKPFDDVSPSELNEVFQNGSEFPVTWDNGKALDVRNSSIALLVGISF